MRANDEPAFSADEFQDELLAMAEHRIVIPHQTVVREPGLAPLWAFRHDKIMDFFLVRAFGGPDNARWEEHLGDSRFRGTYLLMADMLEEDEADELQRMLVDYAADSRDNSTFADFVIRLRARKQARLSAEREAAS